MHKYIFKRIIMVIPVLIVATLIVFTIIELTPGDPARMILGNNATTEAVKALREDLGLNKPFLIKYINFITGAVHGDFGKSYKTKTSVADEIFSRLPVTLKLTFFCVLISIIFGIPIGILSALKQYSIADSLITSFALLLASIPDFWLGLILILIFSLGLGIFPATGADSLINFVLPSITLAAVSTAVLIRMTRSTMLEVIRQDYIRTAKAKGALNNRIIIHHALGNAMLPVVTEIGNDIASLIGGTVLVESVFGMPGVGRLLVDGVRGKDAPMVLGCIVLMSVVASLVNLTVDISYAFIDPRIKAQYK